MEENKKVSNDKMKNGIIIALVLIIVLGGSFLASELRSSKSESNNSNNSGWGDSIDIDDLDVNQVEIDAKLEATKILDEERKAHNSISVEQYLDLKDGKTSSVVYIGRPTCGFCTVASPILEHVAFKNNITINYVNTDEISDNEAIDLLHSDEYFKDGYGTPLVLIVKNNKIVAKFEGLTTIKGYTDFFKENGII